MRTFARQGEPADAILDVAEEENADLIVVGNKGMTGAKRFLLGSVPNKVSHHAPCSVLISPDYVATGWRRGRGLGRRWRQGRRCGGRVQQPTAVELVVARGAESRAVGLEPLARSPSGAGLGAEQLLADDQRRRPATWGTAIDVPS